MRQEMRRTCLLALAVLLPFLVAISSAELTLVNLPYFGQVQGRVTPHSIEFLGVPYAAPPVGDLRFRPPQPAQRWGFLNATTLPKSCPQAAGVPQSEDCLYLNIYLPLNVTEDSNLDVAVLAHGGAFVKGSSALSNMNGTLLANSTNTMVIIPNYRLGLLGLMGHPAFLEDSASNGNYLLYDLMYVLKWLRNNAEYFGGNKRNIVMGGQSAGAISTAILLTSPLSWGLFDKAYLLTGTFGVLDSTEDMKTFGNRVSNYLGCNNGTSQEIVACLRSKSVSDLLAAQAYFNFVKPRPGVDGIVVVEQPAKMMAQGIFQRIPVLVGLAANESAFLVGRTYPYTSTVNQFNSYITSMFGSALLPTFNELYKIENYESYFSMIAAVDTDFYYTCTNRRMTDYMTSRGARNVYRYFLQRNPAFANHEVGAYHTLDQHYLLGWACLQQGFPYGVVCPAANVPQFAAGSIDAAVQNTFREAWKNFISTGIASDSVVGTWPDYRKSDHKYVDIAVDGTFSVINEAFAFHDRECDWFDTYSSWCGDDVCGHNESIDTCWRDCRD